MSANTVTTARRLTGAVAAGALVLAACGSDDAAAPPDTVVPVTEPAPTTTGPSGPASTDADVGGWIGGEPDWDAFDGGGALAESAEADLADAAATGRDLAAADSAVEESAGDVGEAEVVEPTPIEPGDDSAPPVDQPLRAGSVDDGADFAGFQQYVERVTAAGFAARDADLRGRIVVTVTDSDGRPVPGAAVLASPAGDGAEAAAISGRTTADGTVRFFPGLHGVDPALPLAVGLADGSVEPVVAEPGSEVSLTAAPAAIADPVPLDVLFLLDATGSMGDEIDRLKTTIDSVADRVNQLDPRPDVRFAMTLYRDVGDVFVSSTFDFTSDVDVFRDALADVVADGGGDYPEALDEGLAEALAAPAWRDPAQAVQLVFLVADAPPQIGRQVDTPYTDSIRTAIDRGVKIFPIASSESDDVAELVFRQLAVTTGAPFVFLSYGADGAATGGSTDIDRTDYEELALDELVVRLIAEELADLSGGDQPPVPPTTVAPPTTNPDGQ